MAGPEDEPKKDDNNIVDDDAVQDAVQLAMTDEDKTGVQPKKRRLCRYPGCTKVIKSQGHCQRHGARAKRCKVDGCDKQAQVRFNRHDVDFEILDGLIRTLFLFLKASSRLTSLFVLYLLSGYT